MSSVSWGLKFLFLSCILMTVDSDVSTTRGFTNILIYIYGYVLFLDKYFLQEHRYMHDGMIIMTKMVLFVVYNILGNLACYNKENHN